VAEVSKRLVVIALVEKQKSGKLPNTVQPEPASKEEYGGDQSAAEAGSDSASTLAIWGVFQDCAQMSLS
jgi:hypothetical protein